MLAGMLGSLSRAVLALAALLALAACGENERPTPAPARAAQPRPADPAEPAEEPTLEEPFCYVALRGLWQTPPGGVAMDITFGAGEIDFGRGLAGGRERIEAIRCTDDGGVDIDAREPEGPVHHIHVRVVDGALRYRTDRGELTLERVEPN